jgi:phosphate uptake regulator
MLSPVTENLKFMIHEVRAQVEQTLEYFNQPSRALVDRIRARDDYVDTMKSLILDKTFRLLQGSGLTKKEVQLLRSTNTVATNLERIADFSVNMLRQTQHLGDLRFLSRYDYHPFFHEVLGALGRVERFLDQKDLGRAFRICQSEFLLDELYGAAFGRILSELRAGGPPGDLITLLMIFHYLERMGDSLLNIGEAYIFSVVGERLKIQQYQALTESLSASGLKTPISDVEFEAIWGGRSGCRISVVNDTSETDPSRPVLFKHGGLAKITSEKENIETWEKLAPGLPPQVRGFVPGQDQTGSLLLEYLPGCTFQDLVVTKGEARMKDALYMIEETIGQVWSETLKPEPVRAGFLDQMRTRVEGVLRLHPDFERSPAAIGAFSIPSLAGLLDALEPVDQALYAPFSVLIHGDFNVNNILYNPVTERLHFIDLHRSRQTDYIQDVSVFLVSIFRLPVFKTELRRRMNQAIMDFLEFAKDFASRNGDDTFDARLALGLARSFYTSTRFELNRRFARKMYFIAVYLLEKLRAHPAGTWERFELPGEVLVY